MDANYIVMIAVLIIWSGIFAYIFALDRKVTGWEKRRED
jgi:CcmD family protein